MRAYVLFAASEALAFSLFSRSVFAAGLDGALATPGASSPIAYGVAASVAVFRSLGRSVAQSALVVFAVSPTRFFGRVIFIPIAFARRSGGGRSGIAPDVRERRQFKFLGFPRFTPCARFAARFLVASGARALSAEIWLAYSVVAAPKVFSGTAARPI